MLSRLAAVLASGPLRRLLVTAGVVMIYRAGCAIPLPGLDPATLDLYARQSTRLPLERLSIFSLGLGSLFSVLMLVELVKSLVPPLVRWERRDAEHAIRVRRGTLIVALVLAGIQAIGIANVLQSIPWLVEFGNDAFPAETVATLVGATALLIWLAALVTRQGLGNGFWLILTMPTLMGIPTAVRASAALQQQGIVSSTAVFIALVFLIASLALIVTVEMAQDGVDAPSPPADLGQVYLGHVWPPLLASVVTGFLLLPFGALVGRDSAAASWLAVGGFVHLLLLALLILLFTYGRARGENGGEGEGGGPIWTRALAQIMVCLGAELMTRNLGLPFGLNGAWLILVINLALSWLVSLGIVMRKAPAVASSPLS